MVKRVVVTGVGAIAANGNTATEMWENMKKGVNGIDYISSLDTTDMPVKVAGEIKNFDPLLYMDKKQVRRMDKYCRYAMAAGSQAMEDAGFTDSALL